MDRDLFFVTPGAEPSPLTVRVVAARVHRFIDGPSVILPSGPTRSDRLPSTSLATASAIGLFRICACANRYLSRNASLAATTAQRLIALGKKTIPVNRPESFFLAACVR